MNALPLMLGALCVMAIAYRYYSAFIAAKVLALDDARVTPAHRLHDGSNYEATNKWVLFGHHFAAIAGAGPLIGPTLAAQFGYLPGFLWLLIGVVLAGAVHDLVALAASVRRDGRSLAEIARIEISPTAGIVATIAILIIIVVSMAGLGLAVVNALVESSWGVFTIAMTIPIAILVGLWMRNIRPGKVGEASLLGFVGVIAAVIGGSYVPGSAMSPWFTFTREELVIGIAVYGFAASVLPVWLLMVPRDYISSYMKVGTVLALIIGVIVVAPDLKMPAFTEHIHGGGPIIPGKVFPFMFITIACGAISGFHSLVATGTTPKLLSRETDARMIGYGGMLMEGVVGIVALIAATALHPEDYYAINLSAEQFAALGLEPVNLALLSAEVGEQVAGRPGGAVSLAVGFAQIFTALPGMASLMSYWYHFAIMFEALFILTTIDTGTRIGRFLLQEYIGKVWKPFERTNWIPGSLVATTLIVYSWAYFVWNGSISMIWPMFGTSNQLLAGVALSVGTSYIINSGRWKYAWVTLGPMLFVTTTTLTAGYFNVVDNFWPLTSIPAKATQGYATSALTVVMMVCAVIVLVEAFRKWYRVIFLHHDPYDGTPIEAPRMTGMVMRCC
ncbi:MAG: carbon starvation protein A [Bacteroidetes bacterium]|jgi:carbon starvation protein|nr:carbon starvation protein A [Bacteroidota bacterium]